MNLFSHSCDLKFVINPLTTNVAQVNPVTANAAQGRLINVYGVSITKVKCCRLQNFHSETSAVHAVYGIQILR
jgi:hypothetical protein